jgi:hypothetical protein
MGKTSENCQEEGDGQPIVASVTGSIFAVMLAFLFTIVVAFS